MRAVECAEVGSDVTARVARVLKSLAVGLDTALFLQAQAEVCHNLHRKYKNIYSFWYVDHSVMTKISLACGCAENYCLCERII